VYFLTISLSDLPSWLRNTSDVKDFAGVPFRWVGVKKILVFLLEPLSGCTPEDEAVWSSFDSASSAAVIDEIECTPGLSGALLLMCGI
jgi:hypothetical protein